MIGRELRSGARHAVTTERRFFHKGRHIVGGRLTISCLSLSGDGARREKTAMVHAIVALAKSLRVDVIARGVDEPTHLQCLREIGCHRGQGRLYSVPLPARHHS